MKIISSLKKGMLKLVATTLFAAALMAAAQTSSANTGAGTTILNVVTVNYQSPSGLKLVASASASVTVTLVPTAVALAAVAGVITGATPSGTPITYSFTATSQANGGDTYQLNFATGALSNATLAAVAPVVFNQGGVAITSLRLASSVISDVTAVGTIVVPAGTALDFAVNDIVVINATSYAISAISGLGSAATANVSATTPGLINAETPVSITLTANGAGPAPAFTPSVAGTPSAQIGLLVAEQQAFTVDVTSSTVAPGDGTVPLDITVGGPAGTPVTPPITTTTTVQGANLTITKEVSSDGGVTFAAAGSGAPLSTLTYRITISNGGAGSASAVVITDPMPAYTTYTLTSAKSSAVAGALFTDVANIVLTDAADAPIDEYDFGVTAPNQATLSVPTVAAGATVVLFYQVTIQ